MRAIRESFLHEILGHATPTYVWFQAICESFLHEIHTSYGSTKVFSLESLPLYGIFVAIKFLHFLFIHCTQDIVSGGVCALLFFAVSVPMEFYNGEWSEISGIIEFIFEISPSLNNIIDPSELKSQFNLDQLIPASGAAAVSC